MPSFSCWRFLLGKVNCTSEASENHIHNSFSILLFPVHCLAWLSEGRLYALDETLNVSSVSKNMIILPASTTLPSSFLSITFSICVALSLFLATSQLEVGFKLKVFENFAVITLRNPFHPTCFLINADYYMNALKQSCLLFVCEVQTSDWLTLYSLNLRRKICDSVNTLSLIE